MHIGPYQVLLELGRGGMATVYLGRIMGAGGFERLVAIKRAHPPTLAADDLAERFVEEARLAATVHHANVVGIHQAGLDGDGYYLACDYVEGESLAGLVERIRRQERLPQPIALRIVLDALAGLHAVHETVGASGEPLDILHRDVSVENLMVGLDGVTRLTDFGIAKSALSVIHTEAGLIHGKVLYLTPEYLEGNPSDRSSDTYAMGVTLWVALAGTFPYKSRDNASLMHEVLNSAIPSLRSAGVQAGPMLEAFLARACHQQRASRFGTAREMLEALEEVGSKECSVAKHRDVAAYVDRVSGKDLATRRTTIKLRRAELENSQVTPLPVRDIGSAPTDPTIAMPRPRSNPSRQKPRSPGQLVVTGLVLIALAGVAAYLSSGLSKGSDAASTEPPRDAQESARASAMTTSGAGTASQVSPLSRVNLPDAALSEPSVSASASSIEAGAGLAPDAAASGDAGRLDPADSGPEGLPAVSVPATEPPLPSKPREKLGLEARDKTSSEPQPKPVPKGKLPPRTTTRPPADSDIATDNPYR